MNEILRERILRKLDTLSDERAYQVLDFVEFLETKYAERPVAEPSIFQRFAETVEDQLRSGALPPKTVAEAMSLMSRAVGVLNRVAEAGKTVASDLVNAATTPTGAQAAGQAGSATPTSPAAGGATPSQTTGAQPQ